MQQQLMHVHDADHYFKNSLFKVISYEISIQIFPDPQISYGLVVGWLMVGAFGRWSGGRWSVVGVRLVDW